MTAGHYRSKLYQSNRAQLLASSPVCHWCGTRKATTADHLVEVDQGGGHGLDNLVPACAKCNYRRGAQYGNAKRGALTKARNAAVQAAEAQRGGESVPAPSKPARKRAESKAVSLMPAKHPDASMLSVSPKSAKPGPEPAEPTETGPTAPNRPPRLVTPVDSAGSYGDRVAAWSSRVLGVELMPWQREALAGQLAHDDAGALVHRHSLISCARQNGKSVALRALVGWWLVEAPALRGGPQTVITTAHALDLAVALFQDLAPVLEEHYGAKSKWSYGRNELTMPDGSKWYVRAATPAAGHGRSPDLVVVDEVWDVSDEVIDQGLIPAQRARRRPLLSMWSTAGTEASRAMLRWRDAGVRAIDAGGGQPLYFAEWSPPPGVDLDDPAWWEWANPALGHTLELETLVAESKSPNRSAFLRASLNMWVASDQSWLEPGVWDRLEVPAPPPPATVLAVDSSQDESRYCGVLAGVEADTGRTVVSVGFVENTEAGMWARVRELLPAGATLAVTPTLETHVPPELKTRTTTVGYGELLRWTGLVRNMIGEGQVGHLGEHSLNEHIGRAVAVRTQAGVALSSQRSPGPIELARCAVWAAALASRPRWSSRPTVASSRRR